MIDSKKTKMYRFGENGLPVSRNINLTTNEGLWVFYRGLSQKEIEDVRAKKFTTLNKHFTTNKKRALSYSIHKKAVIRIEYQVAFNVRERLRIFNRLQKNKDDFFDIINERDLPFCIDLVHSNWRYDDYTRGGVRLFEGDYTSSFQDEFEKIFF